MRQSVRATSYATTTAGLVGVGIEQQLSGGTPPSLVPYFAVKAAMEALAVAYARELTRWGIKTPIIVPGAFTADTNHFAKCRITRRPEGVRRVRGGTLRKFWTSSRTSLR